MKLDFFPLTFISGSELLFFSWAGHKIIYLLGVGWKCLILKYFPYLTVERDEFNAISWLKITFFSFSGEIDALSVNPISFTLVSKVFCFRRENRKIRVNYSILKVNSWQLTNTFILCFNPSTGRWKACK